MCKHVVGGQQIFAGGISDGFEVSFLYYYLGVILKTTTISASPSSVNFSSSVPGGAIAGQWPSEVSPVVVAAIALREDSAHRCLTSPGGPFSPFHQSPCVLHTMPIALCTMLIWSVILFCGVIAQLGCTVRKQAEVCSDFYWVLLAWLEDWEEQCE